LSRGVYALPELPAAAAAAAVARGVLSHESAARVWNLSTLLEPDRVHITVPPGGRPVNAHKTQVHQSVLAQHEVHHDVPGPITSPRRTVLDCATSLPFAEALAIADSALQRALVDHDELVAAADRSRGRGRQAKLTVVRHADARAANAFESGLRAIVIEAGLTGFVPQVTIRTPRLTARVDLADVDRKIVLEADSYAFHGSRQALERDCRRYDELTLAGWLVLRFAWEHVMFEADWVGAAVGEACELRRRSTRS
jgi:very-short-patch-repair endonuclease